jgi:hypothetical protein
MAHILGRNPNQVNAPTEALRIHFEVFRVSQLRSDSGRPLARIDLRPCPKDSITALTPRVRRHQIVRAIVNYKLAVVLAAVLDGEHPGLGVVDHPVPPRIFRNFVQPRVALLLNHVRSVRHRLLNQLHHIGFRLVSVSRRVVLVLAEVRTDV